MLINYVGTVICFGMSLINIVYIFFVGIESSIINIFAAILCFGCGIVCYIIDQDMKEIEELQNQNSDIDYN